MPTTIPIDCAHDVNCVFLIVVLQLVVEKLVDVGLATQHRVVRPSLVLVAFGDDSV